MRRWDNPGDEPLHTDPPWEEDVYLPPRRRKMGAWIVASLLTLSLAVVGWAAEKRYHVVAQVEDRLAGRKQATLATPAPQAAQGTQTTPAPSPSAPAGRLGADPRVEAFVADGDRSLATGSLEAAQADFDKASVLVERDPRVLLGEARVATAKAEVPWLKLRLLSTGGAGATSATEELRISKSQLDERVAVARQAADDALSAAPHEPAALRAKLDALRLGGDAEGARGYAGALFAQASQPDTAYSLAALDLGLTPAQAPASSWGPIVDRLRLAADGEGGAGKARAALVYALARSGDVTGAKVELTKLDAQARPYPVLPELHAWLHVDPGAMAGSPPVTALTAPVPDTPAAPQPAAANAAPPVAAAGGADTTLQAAAQAAHRGDYERAARIYQGILATRPGDAQALTGLGDVLRVHNDPWGAIEAYERALTLNPSYLPANLGLADTQYARGDKEGAARSYKRIIDRFPGNMYPAYVTQRAQ